MSARKPRFYFAFRSPYAWIAARQIEERFPEARAHLEYIPYWEPDKLTSRLLREQGGEIIYGQMSKAKHLYILQDIKRLTARRGYQVRWPIDIQPWWELPHLAYLRARALGQERAFFWATYRARWEHGQDICSPAVIQALAAEVGLEPQELAQAPEEPALRQEGAEALFRSFQDGVFGVPFFICGSRKYWGVDRLEDFCTDFANYLSERSQYV